MNESMNDIQLEVINPNDFVGWAIGIISNVDAPAEEWPQQNDEWRGAARAFLDSVSRATLRVDTDMCWAIPDVTSPDISLRCGLSKNHSGVHQVKWSPEEDSGIHYTLQWEVE